MLGGRDDATTADGTHKDAHSAMVNPLFLGGARQGMPPICHCSCGRIIHHAVLPLCVHLGALMRPRWGCKRGWGWAGETGTHALELPEGLAVALRLGTPTLVAQ